jgi:hypothetical protein
MCSSIARNTERVRFLYHSTRKLHDSTIYRAGVIKTPTLKNRLKYIMGSMETNEDGWISYGAGDNSQLTDEQRRMVEERIRERQEQQGGLLGIVMVSVYEHGCQSQVNFPDGSLLGVEADASAISEIVSRASAELANWR